MQKKTILLISSFSILFFSYGILVGHYNYFPFEIISDIKNTISPQSEPTPRIQIHQDLSETNKLISFNNSKDILMKKKILIEHIWSGDTLL